MTPPTMYESVSDIKEVFEPYAAYDDNYNEKTNKPFHSPNQSLFGNYLCLLICRAVKKQSWAALFSLGTELISRREM